MITEAKGFVENKEAIGSSVALCNDIGEKRGGLSIDSEGLNLKDDLNNTMENGDDEIGHSEPGGVDSRPLLEKYQLYVERKESDRRFGRIDIL